ncbi:DUF2252 domain-containing protein [Dyella terrae]|uniref:DUF2252 domain-containing protein n=3 Tax=Rhodanobacteraceae TaxID=1775411 RepID=A0A4R0YE61_9GAMM|nr:DUF2252 domain-containing protein [Dyella terrae]TCI06263.1 DUF2252 domain-containing protein [Dyella soli]
MLAGQEHGDPLEQSHRLPVAERQAVGRALRVNCSRKSHGDWQTGAHRRDPVEILIDSSKGRVKELIPIRYGRMMRSPFAFYRGAAAIMANDLSHTPSTGIHLQICGDCHLLNFGGFATPERKIVFDINDFDETTIGPWEWDVKRLAASMFIAAQANGFNKDQARDAAWNAADGYAEWMKAYEAMPVLEAWYDQMNLEDVIAQMEDAAMRKFTEARIRKATEQTAHTKEFVKLSVAGGDPPRIKDEPPLIYHEAKPISRKQGEKVFAEYRSSLPTERRVLLDRFKPVDHAMKVVGVGSVGTTCGIILLISGSGDPLFLQFKEARQSVIEPFVKPTIYSNQGQRVVAGQRLMQSASDIFLGWTKGEKLSFYVRQLRDAKISPEIEIMKPNNLRNYGRLCGRSLARAHARSGDAVLLSAYLGKSDAFPDALARFAEAYAEQNLRDHAALVDAVRSGKVEAKVID